MHVRQATEGDVDPVTELTRDTWPEREFDDYVPRLFPEWVATDDERRRTIVLDARPADATGSPGPADLAGIVRSQLLTDREGWVQGLRVNPAYRGQGCGKRLLNAGLEFAREAGAAVARCMILSWNAPSLGLCRSVGFGPATEFRWAFPEPTLDADADAVDGVSVADTDRSGTGDVDRSPAEIADAAWTFWTASDVRTHLRGLALDADESWALSELTHSRMRAAAEEGRLIVVRSEDGPDGRRPGGARRAGSTHSDCGTRGTTLRVRTFERPTDGNGIETWAEYAVGAWADSAAARAVVRAAASDAAAVGADRARMLIPESTRWVSDAAAAQVEISEEPDFVLAADLTDRRGRTP